MFEPRIEILGAAAVLGTFVGLVELISGTLRRQARGWVSILIGLSMLWAGGVLTMIPPLPLPLLDTADTPPPANFARDVCLLGAALFLGAGLYRRIVSNSRSEQVAELSAALARVSRELSSSQELLNSIVESSVSGLMVLQAARDPSGALADLDVRLVNREAEQLLGLSGAVLKRDRLLRHLPCLKDEGLLKAAISVIETKLPFREERSCRHGGRERWYQIAAVKYGDGVVVAFADTSDRKRAENRLRHAAQHDTLTGTPNRAMFTVRLEQALKRVHRQAGYRFAVLFLDVDRFKVINDSLGHEAGDQLLISIAERLRSNLSALASAETVASGEGHLPARLGGDEFAVLLDGIRGIEEAVAVAERLQAALSSPHHVAGHEVTSTISIGIVTCDEKYWRPDDVLRDADTAMYQAKRAGKAQHVVFDEKMHSDALERLNLERELRKALDNREFTILYQPIVALDTAALVGFEALLRWQHPQRGMVLPMGFIGLAEELGLIVPIGRWVLEEACRQLEQWQEACPDQPGLTMSVNLSRLQLSQRDFVPQIETLIRDFRMQPGTLLLEITETSVMAGADDILPVLRRLHETGVRLAMDDFGTGHSSLSFLHRAPMDILKIDRAFIKSVVTERDSAAIVRTIVQLAHTLEMRAIAEGIETKQQLRMLQALDCHYGQGYLFGRPMPAAEAAPLLSRKQRFPLAA
jgi:diguanylate cyclase (GGDEF)-like protein